MGAYLGGFIMTQCSQMKGLMICGVAQMVTNLGYIWLHHAGYDITIFLITNICENFTGGMGAAAMSTYISSLCNIRFAANQFALLCSCSTLINNSLTASAGVFVEQMGWDNYFIFTTVISLPSLMMLYILNKKLNQE